MSTNTFNFDTLFPDLVEDYKRRNMPTPAPDPGPDPGPDETQLPDVKVKDGDFFTESEINDRNRAQLDLNRAYGETLDADSLYTRGERAGLMGAPTADLETRHGLQRLGIGAAGDAAGLGLGSGIVQDAAVGDEINAIFETMDLYSKAGVDEFTFHRQLRSNVLNMMAAGVEQDRAASAAIANWNNKVESEISGVPSSLQAGIGGAVGGASQGAKVAGPVGAIVGGIIGGIGGIFGSKDKKKKLRKLLRNDNILPVDRERYQAELDELIAAEEGPLSEAGKAELTEDGLQAIQAKGNLGLQASRERGLTASRKTPNTMSSFSERYGRNVRDAKRRLGQTLDNAALKVGKSEQNAAMGLQQRELASQRAAEVGVTPQQDMSPSWANTLLTAGAAGLGLYGQLSGGGGSSSASSGASFDTPGPGLPPNPNYVGPVVVGGAPQYGPVPYNPNVHTPPVYPKVPFR